MCKKNSDGVMQDVEKKKKKKKTSRYVGDLDQLANTADMTKHDGGLQRYSCEAGFASRLYSYDQNTRCSAEVDVSCASCFSSQNITGPLICRAGE